MERALSLCLSSLSVFSLGDIITPLVLLITYDNVLKNKDITVKEKLYDTLQGLPYAPDPLDQLRILLVANNNNNKIQFTEVWQSLVVIHKYPSFRRSWNMVFWLLYISQFPLQLDVAI